MYILSKKRLLCKRQNVFNVCEKVIIHFLVRQRWFRKARMLEADKSKAVMRSEALWHPTGQPISLIWNSYGNISDGANIVVAFSKAEPWKLRQPRRHRHDGITQICTMSRRPSWEHSRNKVGILKVLSAPDVMCIRQLDLRLSRSTALLQFCIQCNFEMRMQHYLFYMTLDELMNFFYFEIVWIRRCFRLYHRLLDWILYFRYII